MPGFGFVPEVVVRTRAGLSLPAVRRAAPRALLAAFLACVTSASPTPAPADSPAGSWEAIPADAWKEQARPDSGGGDAEILLQHIEDWDLKGDFRHRVFRRIRVFTEDGRDAGKVEVVYDRNARIEYMRAHSIRQNGSTTELSPDQVIQTIIEKRNGVEWNMATFIVPGIEPGCIIEYDYAIAGKYRGGWHSTSYFQNDLYTLEAVYQWHPSEWIVGRSRPAMWDLRKIYAFQVATETKPDSVKPQLITFRTTCVPGFSAEPFSPPLADAGARVATYYGFGNTTVTGYWSFAKRAMEVVGERYLNDLGPLESVVSDASAHTADPLEALAIVHRWLETHVRAIHELSWTERQGNRPRPRIEALEGRFEDPRAPGWPVVVWQWVVGPVRKDSPIRSLVEHGWGTPYEINAAFVAAAQRLGLQACVAFVGDRRDEPFDGQIGQLPGDVISAVRKPGAAWTFYDPASTFSPVGSIPWYLRGGKALLCGAGSELFANIHANDGSLAPTMWRIALTLDENGDLDGRVSGAFVAEAARDIKSLLWEEDPDRWSERLQKDLAPGGVPKLEFERPELGIDPDSTFVLAGHVRYEDFATGVGGVMTLPLDRLLPWRFRAEFPRPRRSQPLFFRHAKDQTLEVSVRLPAGASARDLPAPREFENELGRFRTSWTRTDEGVRYQRTVRTALAEFDRRDYGMARDFFKALDVADGDVLLVKMP
jgi:Domain of Unknown Function with PDB structure (DUF3857)